MSRLLQHGIGDSGGQTAEVPRPRKIIHIDMDAFFAAVEQRDHPDLIFVKHRFDVYKEVSRQVRAIFAAYTPLVEPTSLDEAYLDVTDTLHGLTATEVAKRIRARIAAETGLTASAGVSYNKFLAKLASNHNKPDGLFVIPPEMGPSFVETLPVAKFHGVGPATAARMHRLGIHTGLDLRGRSLSFLLEAFGKAGRFYYNIARGIDARPVRSDRIRKSIGAENTFSENLTTPEALAEGIHPLVGKVWRHCEGAGVSGRTVTVKVKYADFQLITRSRTLPEAVVSETALYEISLGLLAPVSPSPKAVRLLGVAVSNLNALDICVTAPRQLRVSWEP